MAADGSVTIEITGNLQDFQNSMNRAKAASRDLADELKQVDRALQLDPGNADLIAQRQALLQEAIEQTTRSLHSFETAQEQALELPATADNEVMYRALTREVSAATQELNRLQSELAETNRAADRLENAMDGDISGEIDEAARAADNLDDALDDAAQAADRLERSTDSAGGGMSRLRDGFTTLKGTVAGVASDMVTRAIDAFVGLGVEAVNAADAMVKFENTMAFAGIDPAVITQSKDALEAYANQTVYDLETVLNTGAQLGANGVANFEKLTMAAGNLNAAASGDAESFKSFAMALTQTVGAGKLTTENWNQIADAIPGASGILQEEMLKNGAYVGNFRDAMAEGQITAEEFAQAVMNLGLTEAATEAATSTKTIAGSIDALKATIVEGLVSVLTDAGGMEGITGFINGFVSILEDAGTYIGPIIDSIRTSIGNIGVAFRSAFTPEQQSAILNFLKTLASMLVAAPFAVVSASVNTLSVAFQALIVIGSTVVAVIQLIIDTIGAIVSPVDTVKGAFSTFGETMSNVFSGIGGDAQEASNGISGSFDDIANSAQESTDQVVSSVETGFSQIPESAQAGLDATLNNVETWGGTLQTSAADAATGAANNVKNGLEAIPDDASSSLANTIDNVAEWGTEMTETATSASEETAEGIKTSLEDVVPTAETVGREIANGLAAGIRVGKSGVVSAATEVATAAIQAAKTKLDIHSPSKELETLGLFTSEGFAEGIKGGIKYVDDAVDELTADTKDHVEELNAEIERIEEEAAKRQAEKELADHEKALADLYKELEEAELDKRDAINEKIAKLEADWAEKQLKAQENAQKEALESQIKALEATEAAYEEVYASMQDALEEFSDEYQSALDEVAQDRDSLAGELSDFSLFDLHEGEMHVWSIQPMIDQINAYGEAITGLQDRGVNQSLLNEILELDRQEATQFANELLAMSDEQYTQYMALWQEKEDAAAQVAASVYQGEMDAIETEYAEKLPEMMAETADEAMLTLAEHLESTGETAVLTAANIADRIIAEIERINAAQSLAAGVMSASESFGGQLSSNVQNAADGASASRSAQATETAGALSMVNTVSASREIVLNINGKEMARTFVPDLRAVEDQSPQIVSDTR